MGESQNRAKAFKEIQNEHLLSAIVMLHPRSHCCTLFDGWVAGWLHLSTKLKLKLEMRWVINPDSLNVKPPFHLIKSVCEIIPIKAAPPRL